MPKPKKETQLISIEEFERAASAIMQVSKEELAEVIEVDKPEHPSKKRSRPPKTSEKIEAYVRERL